MTADAHPTPPDAGLLLHLQQLSIRVWSDLDENAGRGWPDQFTPAGIFDFNGRLTTGHAALRTHFEARAARGPRVTLHALTNLVAELQDADHASVDAAICTYGADGDPPQPVALPTLIGTTTDHFERQPDGRWLIAVRRFRPKFYNPDDRVGRSVIGG